MFHLDMCDCKYPSVHEQHLHQERKLRYTHTHTHGCLVTQRVEHGSHGGL